ncbi:hypothetical protein [Methylobacterium sp. 10]|uniref:hypothetical protein n=1 Tax=Methylobacterium sp. 10 TaxID=1101191 RepID=UPI0012DBCF30|nr:hypothetical protein [Methylobacterium sp. 10]
MDTAGPETAARRLRERHARKLVIRYVETGAVLAVLESIGWILGLTAQATVAALCVGLPVMALVRHIAVRAIRCRTIRAFRTSSFAPSRPNTLGPQAGIGSAGNVRPSFRRPSNEGGANRRQAEGDDQPLSRRVGKKRDRGDHGHDRHHRRVGDDGPDEHGNGYATRYEESCSGFFTMQEVRGISLNPMRAST